MARSFVQRNPALARAVLYGTPVLLVALTLWLVRWNEPKSPSSPWDHVDWLEQESVQILQEYLQIDTTHESGSELEAAEMIARRLREAGVESVEVERIGDGKANLWAVLPGDDPRPLVLHQHMDTEPIVSPGAWVVPPFAGAIDSPFIFGRGAFDMKSIGTAQIVAFLDVARSRAPLRRSLMLLATGDEEVDSWLGTQHLLRTRPEWHDELWAVLTEGGAVEALELDKIKYWGTEFQHNRYLDIWLCDANRERLEDLKSELVDLRFERNMTPGIAEFFRAYAPTRDREATRELLAEPEVLFDRLRSFPIDVDAEVLPNRIEDTMRRGFSVGPVLEDQDAGGYLMHVIVHLMAGDQLDEIWPEMIGDRLDGFTYTIETYHPPVPDPSPVDHPVFQTIDRLIEERFQGVVHGPLYVPYIATDARFFRAVGIPSYGFTPFRFQVAEAMSFRGANERISLPAFVEGAALYTELVKRLVVRSEGTEASRPVGE